MARANTRTTTMILTLVLAAGATAACGTGGGDDGGGELPAACLPQPTPGGWTYPAGPYGTDLGDVMADLVLDDCDGTPVRLSDVLSEASVVLVSVGAGWCTPCILETMVIEAEVFEPYCEGGLRIIQILFQDDQSAPATKLFCQGWRDTYRLRFPVLVDPLFTMEPYFGGPTSTTTPLNLLLDAGGVIRWRATGGVAKDVLASQIEAML